MREIRSVAREADSAKRRAGGQPPARPDARRWDASSSPTTICRCGSRPAGRATSAGRGEDRSTFGRGALGDDRLGNVCALGVSSPGGRFLSGPDTCNRERASRGPSPVEPTPVLPFQALGTLEESLAPDDRGGVDRPGKTGKSRRSADPPDHSKRAPTRAGLSPTSLNFPLHWTSAVQSWNYLFRLLRGL